MALKFATGKASVFMQNVDAKHARKWFMFHLIAFVSIGLLMASHPLPNQKQYWSDDHGNACASSFHFHKIEAGAQYQIISVANLGNG